MLAPKPGRTKRAARTNRGPTKLAGPRGNARSRAAQTWVLSVSLRPLVAFSTTLEVSSISWLYW